MFKCEIKTGGAAFRNLFTGEEDVQSEGYELSRILSRIAREVEAGATSGSIMDLNGNKVGTWSR